MTPSTSARPGDGSAPRRVTRSGARPVGLRGGPVIALVGIDGCGKTTQARRLADWLTARGVAARYWQNAGGRRWLGRVARRVGRADADALLGPSGLLLVESVLRWLAVARALVWSRVSGRAAVMDRYAVCQYVSARLRDSRRERPVRAWYRLFPEPDVTFLLTVPPVEACRRVDARGTDRERAELLAAAAAAYAALPEADRFVRVDADRPVEQVFRDLTAHLERLAPPGRPG